MDKENFIFWLESHTRLSSITAKKYAGAIKSISVDMKKITFSLIVYMTLMILV